MNYELTTTPAINDTECLVIGVCCDNNPPDFIALLDKQHNGLVERLASKLAENGDTAWQTDFDGRSLLVIHCGSKASYTANVVSKRIADIAALLFKQRISSATICMPQLINHTPDWQVQQMLLQFDAQRYQLLDFKSKQNKPYAIESVLFFQPNSTEETIKTAQAIANGVQFARTLANYPANICTPTYIANEAVKLAHKHSKLNVKVHNREYMQAMGMGALLAVAQGSHEPPQLVELQYNGAGNDSAPVVLVGKGITFDSGGISIKPADGMNEMKFDMAGAASVLGTIKACALLNLPINVIGLLACAENMPGGGAIKPGDIITTHAGHTVEIVNTDAEGRLVLADALTYAEQFKPCLVIDIATLTGAVIIALGCVSTGVMTPDDDLANLILTAARESEDKTWRLPLDEAYQEALDSPIADMVNATFDRSAGSITAGCFLSRFTGNYRWAHLDIAGTGRPVPLLVQLLRDLAHAS